MLQIADGALYRAKTSGRDRVVASGDRRASNTNAA
jgi:PleD family two-component response regulator